MRAASAPVAGTRPSSSASTDEATGDGDTTTTTGDYDDHDRQTATMNASGAALLRPPRCPPQRLLLRLLLAQQGLQLRDAPRMLAPLCHARLLLPPQRTLQRLQLRLLHLCLLLQGRPLSTDRLQLREKILVPRGLGAVDS